jgi:2-oxoglutarate ferredoxin oxidoreductase subunit alpha
LLSEGTIANAAEPWRIPNVDSISEIEASHPSAKGEDFQPYNRDPKTLAREWAIPGTPKLEHRLGGLEKEDGSGNVCYDHDNHAKMTKIRAEKIQRLQSVIPALQVEGEGDTLILGWGGTRGSILTAAAELQARGVNVATAHLRHLNPFPRNLGEVLSSYKKIIIPEINAGQLRSLIRSEFLVDAIGINNLTGRSFFVSELANDIEAIVKGGRV